MVKGNIQLVKPKAANSKLLRLMHRIVPTEVYNPAYNLF